MDQLSIPFTQDERPAALVAKTSERSDGSLMLGRWSKQRRGRVEVRLDLHDASGGYAPVARFALEMN
jgi:hypothetical protein